MSRNYIFGKLSFVTEDYVPRHINSITKTVAVDKNIRKVQNERIKGIFINKQNIKIF